MTFFTMLNNRERCITHLIEDETGFTLVEMIFVVLLLATLLGMASFSISGIQDQATTDLVWVDLKLIRSAARTFYLENKRFPNTIIELNGYLDELPDDKFLNGTGVKYTLALTGGSCTLKSVGPDRKSDTADDLLLTFSP